MKPFLVLSPGAFIDKMSLQIALTAFTGVYFRVTPKHQRRLRLIIIEETEHIPKLKQLLYQSRIYKVVQIIDRIDVDRTIKAYKTANAFLLPSKKNSVKYIIEALSFGIPVLTFEQPDAKHLLDPSCSMLFKGRNSGYDAEGQFSNMIEMLYFDPEVRKILAKGALRKNNDTLKWGTRGMMVRQ